MHTLQVKQELCPCQVHLVMIKKSPLKKMYDNQTFFYYVENNKHTNYWYLFSMERVVFFILQKPINKQLIERKKITKKIRQNSQIWLSNCLASGYTLWLKKNPIPIWYKRKVIIFSFVDVLPFES